MTQERKEKILEILNKFRIFSAENTLSDCYGWSGSIKSKKAPPRIYVEGKSVGAHRAAWMVENGKMPANKYIHKTCGNRMCTNPAHLFLSDERINRRKSDKNTTNRPGRERIAVDLPTGLVQKIRKMASKYHMTITKYLFKRLTEIVEYENKLDKKSVDKKHR